MVRVRYNKESHEWKHLTDEDEASDLDMVIDGYRLKYLDQVKKDLRNDLDHVEIISGAVGAGKSTLGRLDCRYVSDEKFRPETHIIRDVNDIKRVIQNAKKYEAILIDEGSGIFQATDTMTKKSKYANYILDVCRQKNLLIVISAPNFHRLTAAVAVDRAMTMTRVYIDSRTGKRGRFAFYGTRAKEKLYRFAKVNYGSLKGAKPKYRGKFGEDKTFTEEYLKLKDDTLNLALESFGEKDKPTAPKIVDDYRVNLVKNNIHMSISELANFLQVSTRTIDRLKKKAKEALSRENAESQNTNQLNPRQTPFSDD